MFHDPWIAQRLTLAPAEVQHLVRQDSVLLEEYREAPSAPGLYAVWMDDSECWRDCCLRKPIRFTPLYVGAARDMDERIGMHLSDRPGPSGDFRRQLQILLHSSGTVEGSEKVVLQAAIGEARAASLEDLSSYEKCEEDCSEWMLEGLRITWVETQNLGTAVALAHFAQQFLRPPLPATAFSALDLTDEGAVTLGRRARWLEEISRHPSGEDTVGTDKPTDDELAGFYTASRALWPTATAADVLMLAETLGRDWWVLGACSTV